MIPDTEVVAVRSLQHGGQPLGVLELRHVGHDGGGALPHRRRRRLHLRGRCCSVAGPVRARPEPRRAMLHADADGSPAVALAVCGSGPTETFCERTASASATPAPKS